MCLVAATAQSLAQDGIYTRQQAAALARVRAATLDRWLAFAPAQSTAARTLGFADLIQLVAVRQIRLERRAMPLIRLRQVADDAARCGYDHPFARDCRIFLLDRDIVLKFPTGELVGATGALRHQHLMEPVLQPYLAELTFARDGLAEEYRPLPGILLTPRLAFGAPVVEACGYTVATLVGAYRDEGDMARAAEACGVDVGHIRLAVKYEDMLAGQA